MGPRGRRRQTTKKVKSAVTDTGREVRFDVDGKPGISNLLTILSVATGKAVPELEAAYDGKGYGDFKADVADAVVELFAPVRDAVRRADRRPRLPGQRAQRGSGYAPASWPRATMATVRDRIGLLAPSSAG